MGNARANFDARRLRNRNLELKMRKRNQFLLALALRSTLRVSGRKIFVLKISEIGLYAYPSAANFDVVSELQIASSKELDSY